MNTFDLIFLAVGFLSGFVPLLPVLVLGQRWLVQRERAQGRSVTAMHLVVAYVLVLFLIAIFTVTGIPDLYHLKIGFDFNFSLLDTVWRSPRQYILNVLLFVPVGMLLPWLWRALAKWWRIFIYGLGLSLMIELMQLFNNRVTDLDDLLTNTLGAMIGYGIFWLVRKLFPCIEVVSFSDDQPWWQELALYFVVVWLGMFFLQPLIQPLITDWLFPNLAIRIR